MAEKCLIWDFDNTLAARDGMWTKSLCTVLHNHGYTDFNQALISECFSSGFPWQRHDEPHRDYFHGLDWWAYIHTLIYKALLAIGFTDDNENQKLVMAFKEEYLRLSAWRVYDDTIATLKIAMDKGYVNVILSNHVPELYQLVAGLGLSGYFEGIISSANVGFEKPNKNLFNEVFKHHKHDDYYMIGDNYHADVQGALAVGIKGILVRSSNTHHYEQYSERLSGIWAFIESI